MNPTFTDGDYTEPQASTPLVLERPFDAIPNLLVGRQKLFQLKSAFVNLARNTGHPDDATFYLVDEVDFTDLGEGVQEWTRVYAQIPPSFNEPGGNFNYNFIGYFGVFGVFVTVITGRNRFSKNVKLQLQHDFFLTGAGGTYSAWQQIPAVEETKYYFVSEDVPVNWLADSPPFITAATTPSRSEYEDMIAEDIADISSFSIVTEAARVERWMGNIFKRTTARIKAI